jgi:hypothetical protein
MPEESWVRFFLGGLAIASVYPPRSPRRTVPVLQSVRYHLLGSQVQRAGKLYSESSMNVINGTKR